MDIILPATIPRRNVAPGSENLIPITIDEFGIKRHPIIQKLMRIDLDLTGLCNRQCSFCPRSLDANPLYPNINKQMSLETVEIVLNELRSIDFNGWFELAGRGESTLHKKFDVIVDMVTKPPRKWKVRLTTNGYRIDQWWDTVGYKLDELLLNSYESEEEYIERQKIYSKLPNGNPVKHYYKQDGFTIEQINKMKPYKEDGVWWKHVFNNRAGYFDTKDRVNENLNYTTVAEGPDGKKLKVSESPCWHPVRQIFIDFDGNYQMCCNDWLHQIKIGNVHERSLIDMYINDPKLNRIRWRLLNKQREFIAPCAKCDDIQGSTKNSIRAVEIFKNSESYKQHVINSSRVGKVYDNMLMEGK